MCMCWKTHNPAIVLNGMRICLLWPLEMKAWHTFHLGHLKIRFVLFLPVTWHLYDWYFWHKSLMCSGKCVLCHALKWSDDAYILAKQDTTWNTQCQVSMNIIGTESQVHIVTMKRLINPWRLTDNNKTPTTMQKQIMLSECCLVFSFLFSVAILKVFLGGVFHAFSKQSMNLCGVEEPHHDYL